MWTKNVDKHFGSSITERATSRSRCVERLCSQYSSGRSYLSPIFSTLLPAVQDALSAFREVASYIPEQTVRDIFYEADNDGHGKVSYRDFSSILCSA